MALLYVAGMVLTAGYLVSNLILVSSFTAQLAAYLARTVEPEQPIASLGDIGPSSAVDHNQVCLSGVGGSVEAYWKKLQQTDRFPSRRAFNEDQVGEGWGWSRCSAELRDPWSPVKLILGDSAVMGFEVAKSQCELEQVGGLFYLQGYSFMMPRDSAFSQDLSESTLRLREAGTIEQLIEGYYNVEGCDAGAQGVAEYQLSLQRVSPIFMFTGAVYLVALLAMCGEQRHTRAVERRLSAGAPLGRGAPLQVELSAAAPLGRGAPLQVEREVEL